jgi:hypothetical protein
MFAQASAASAPASRTTALLVSVLRKRRRGGARFLDHAVRAVYMTPLGCSSVIGRRTLANPARDVAMI